MRLPPIQPGLRWELWVRSNEPYAKWKATYKRGTYAEVLEAMFEYPANWDFNPRSLPEPTDDLAKPQGEDRPERDNPLLGRAPI